MRLLTTISCALAIVLAGACAHDQRATAPPSQPSRPGAVGSPADPVPARPIVLADRSGVAPGLPAATASVPAPRPDAAELAGLQAEFPEAQLVWGEDAPAHADGSFVRTRLIRTTMKYPLIRVEDTLVPGPRGLVVRQHLAMVGDHLLVGLQPGQTEADLQRQLAAIGAAIRGRIPGTADVLVAFDPVDAASMGAVSARLRALPGTVRISEPDYVVRADGTPNDPAFAQLWGMNNTGQTGGTPGCDIKAVAAWAVHTGSRSVKVGVIDTGIDGTHPDLAANMWTNPGEIAGDGIDNDGNGYIDDVHGWNFVAGTANAADDQYHGTHCAGTIGGVGDNATGVAGVCWQVSLVPLKFLNASGQGVTSDAIAAVTYANQIGCDLTSNSWGGGAYSQALHDAIAAYGAAGHLFVAAAGNSAGNNDLTPSYPASYDCANIIAVAATDASDALASFSCYGAASVDLGAPGVAIYSCQPGGLYQLLSGTSMATPHVSGAAALLKSANPLLSASQIKAALLANTDPVPALAGKCVSGGRLNLARAIQAVTGPMIQIGSATIAESGNGDGWLNPGEAALLTVPMQSTGAAAATALTGTITCSDPAVSIEQAVVAYGDLAPGQSSTGGGSYRIRLAAGTATPHSVNLTLTASAAVGGPWSSAISVAYSSSSILSGHVVQLANGLPIAGAQVSWSGSTPGSTPGSAVTDAAGWYGAVVGDGAYTVSCAASGWDAVASRSATVPPSATVDFALGHAGLAVSPSALALSTSAPSATLTVSNPGDAPLSFAASIGGASASPVATGMWHQTTNRAASGRKVWYYGDEAKRNYDTPGSANAGTLTFTGIAVPAAQPTLTCGSWRQAETSLSYDQSLIQVSSNGGASWTTLSQISDSAATWNQVSVSLAAYAGSTVALRFSFNTVDSAANTYEGWYLDDIRVGGQAVGSWLSLAPATGVVAAGASAPVVVSASTDIAPGTYTATIQVTAVGSVASPVAVPVTYVVSSPANLSLGTAAIDDGAVAPSAGDGDGKAEPGEAIQIAVPLANSGTVMAPGVTATLSTSSSQATIPGPSASYGDIAGGATAQPGSRFVVQIASSCPDNTTIPFTVSSSDSAGHSWSGTFSLLVKWSARLSGTVLVTGTATPLAGATITINGQSAVSAANGTFAIAALPAGTYTATATKPGYTTASQSVTLPPDQAWNPAICAPAMVVSPNPVVMTAAKGATTTVPLLVSDPGDGALTCTIQVPGASAGGTATGLWHLTTYRNATGQPCWYYGSEAKRNYDTGAANSGAVTFTGIAVPAGSPSLTYKQWRATEAGSGYDQSLVQASLDGTSWTTVYQTTSTAMAWESISVGLAAYAGKTVALRFFFNTVDSAANTYEGWYVDDIRLNGAALASPAWLSATPTSLSIAPGGSATVSLRADSAQLATGTYNAVLTCTTNVPGAITTTIPVAFTVTSPPSLALGTAVIDDGAVAPSQGDGDGQAEPGESIQIAIPLLNSGSIAATGVTATLATTSSQVSITSATATYPSVPGLGSALPTTRFAVAVLATCPDNTTVPCTVTITDGAGGTWSGSYNLLVKWSSRLSGVVTAYGSGAPVAGVSVAFAGKSAVTASDGSYSISGIGATTGAATTSLYGYTPVAAAFTVPPSQVWNPVIGQREFAITPTSISQVIGRGQTLAVPLTLSATAPMPVTWSLSVSGSNVLAGVAPAAGTTLSGAPTALTATLASGTLANGTYSGYITISSNSVLVPNRTVSYTVGVRSANPPVVAPLQVSTPQETATAITLAGSDADGDPLSYQITTSPGHGTVSIVGGIATYTPAYGYWGTDSFAYRASDGYDTATPATVAITVTHVNHAPVAAATTIVVNPGTATGFTLPVADRDLDPLTPTLVTAPSHGALALSGLAATYTPAAGFAGQDVFWFSASDGSLSSAVVAVTLVVGDAKLQEWPTHGNGPDRTGFIATTLPAANPVAGWTASYDQNINQVAVGGGRVFVSSTYTSTYLSARGVNDGVELWRTIFPSSSLNPPTLDGDSVFIERGKALYEANATLYRLAAGDGSTVWTKPIAAQWERYLAPTVADGGVWVDGGTYGGLYGFDRASGAQRFFVAKPQYDVWAPTWRAGVLYTWVNTEFAAHNPLTGAVLWSMTLPNGSIAYDEFTTPAIDGTRAYLWASNTSTPLVPTLYAVDLASHTVAWSRPASYRGAPALGNGHLFMYSSVGIDEIDPATGAVIRTYPLTGSGTYAGYGSIQPIVTQDAVIGSTTLATAIFTLGNTAPRWSVANGGHISLAGPTLFVANGMVLRTYHWNQAPTVADGQLGLEQDTSAGVALLGADPEGAALSWSIVQQPAHGSLVLSGASLTYTPAPGYYGPDSAQFAASDGVATSAAGTLAIAVTRRPQPVLQIPAAVTTAVDAPVAVGVVASDPRGRALSFAVVGQPAHGSVVGQGPGFTYAPAAGWSGDDCFAVSVSNGLDTVGPVTAVIHVGTDAATSEWSQVGGNPGHTGHVPVSLASRDFIPAWSAAMGAPINQPTVGAGMVFITPRSGPDLWVSARDAGTGMERWRTALPGGAALGQAGYGCGRVMVQLSSGAASQVLALDAATGVIAWQAPCPERDGDRHLSPLVAGGLACVVGGVDRGIYAFDIATGAQQWFVPTGWSECWVPGQGADGLIYAYAGTIMQAIDPATHAVAWSAAGSGFSGQRVSATIVAGNRAAALEGMAQPTSAFQVFFDLDAHHKVNAAWYSTGDAAPAVANGIAYVPQGATAALLAVVDGSQIPLFYGPGTYALPFAQPIVSDDAYIQPCDTRIAVMPVTTTPSLMYPYQNLATTGEIALADGRLLVADPQGLLSVFATVDKRPTAVARSVAGHMGAPIAVAFAAATNPRARALTYAVAAAPGRGTVTGTFPAAVYTSQAGYVGSDSFTYTVSDGISTSLPVTVTVAVSNQAPVANPQSLQTSPGASLVVNLSGSDPDGDALSWRIATPPLVGAASLAGSQLTYSAPAGAAQLDNLQVIASDGQAESAPALIHIAICALPAGWTGQDIGSTGAAGGSNFNPDSGAWTVTGAGSGIGSTADAGQEAVQSISGDFDVVAQIPFLASTSTAARVGILVRDGAAPGARSVFMGLSGDKKVYWTRRTTADAAASSSSWKVTAAPWVKISRRGNVLTGYRGTDPATWTLCSAVVIGLPDALQVGVFGASGTAGSLLAAQVQGYALILPTPAAPGTVAINFQLGTAPAADADGRTWLIADGAPFGHRWAGADYGFAAVTTNAYDRNNALSTDQRYDTSVNAPTSSAFELVVPNGAYSVTVCVGDPTVSSGKIAVDVEGVRAITGNLTGSAHWLTGTVDVTVTDGRLTLSCGSGANTSRWAWALVVPAPQAPNGGG